MWLSPSSYSTQIFSSSYPYTCFKFLTDLEMLTNWAILLIQVTFEQPLHKCCLIWQILMAILVHDIYETMSPPFLHTLSGCYTRDILCWFVRIDATTPYIYQSENIDLGISSSNRLHGSVRCCEAETVLLGQMVKRFIDLTPGLYHWSVSCKRIVIGQT
jgi:hypothetical protein